jgi:hypothetical protein
MPLTRASIIRGPAVVTFNGATFYSKDDIKLVTELETFDIEVSAYGKADERVRNRKMTVSFTPSGAWANLSTLFPYGASAVGSSVFGPDTALSIQTLAGALVTFAAAALTRMPSITASAAKTLLGPLEFTCLGKDNTAWSATSSVYTVASNPFTDSSFVESAIITAPYTVAWGSTAPWNALATQDGVTVDFDLSLKPVETDSEGIVDFTCEKLVVTARLKPVGLSEGQVLAALALQGGGAARGRSLNAAGQTLTIASGSSPSIVLNGANLKSARQLFGPASLRVDELAFVATRTFSGGAAQPLFTVA